MSFDVAESQPISHQFLKGRTATSTGHFSKLSRGGSFSLTMAEQLHLVRSRVVGKRKAVRYLLIHVKFQHLQVII